MPSYAKELMMQEIEKCFEANPYIFISGLDSMSVADLSEFRKNIQSVSNRSILVKHTFAKKVFAKHNAAQADKLLKGAVVLTFGDKEPQNISKKIVEFTKTNQKLVPAGVIFEKNVYDKEFVKQLANLPSRQELLTQALIRMKSPITGFVLTLNQVLRGVVVALNEIKKLKETQGQTA